MLTQSDDDVQTVIVPQQGGPVSAEDRAAATKAARAARAQARAAARAQVPYRSPEFSHLDLAGVRELRRALMEEEDRVSYWRRIIQARLDTVRAGDAARQGDHAGLAPALTQARMNGGRTALVRVVPMDDVPPLPDLERLWATTPDLTDPVATAALVTGLTAAEGDLSTYREALHVKLAACTYELIARYREDPSQCLVALPL